MSEQFQLGVRLEGVFMPYARRQRDGLYDSGAKPAARFVHYTSAEAALKIIESKRVWMRNTTCMADYREVQHGFEILQRFFSDEKIKKEFYAALDAVSPNRIGVQPLDRRPHRCVKGRAVRGSGGIGSVPSGDGSQGRLRAKFGVDGGRGRWDSILWMAEVAPRGFPMSRLFLIVALVCLVVGAPLCRFALPFASWFPIEKLARGRESLPAQTARVLPGAQNPAPPDIPSNPLDPRVAQPLVQLAKRIDGHVWH